VRLQRQLAELPTIRDALQLFLKRGLVPSAGSKVNSTPEPSVPINLAALDLIDEIVEVVSRAGGWTIQVSDLIHRPAEKVTIWSSGSIRERYLDGVDRALDIGHVWRRADGIIGLSRAWERRLAQCPKCNLRTLGSFAGSDSVQCSNCGGVMSRTEYARVTLITAGNQKDKKGK
jgi:hypothetical protein